MKQIINEINSKNHIFYLIIEGRKIGFYLTKRLSKTFWPFLHRGVLVDFEIGPKRKKINRAYAYPVAYFKRIVELKPHRVYYDMEQLRHDMKYVLSKQKHFLFIDFEMTMPGYKPKPFTPEIIQAGYVLIDDKGRNIIDEGYYVLPLIGTKLSKRTIKFLKLDELKFYETAIHYDDFYEKMKHIVETYHPKWIVWGKNDIAALNDSYKLHHKKPLTKQTDFIDLLKLHKDYYNLKNDLGLFKAYQAYYKLEENQDHDALDDAHVTREVFEAFMKHM